MKSRNDMLCLPSERVKRVNPFSIFFLMYSMVCLCGAGRGGLTVGMLMLERDPAAMSSSQRRRRANTNTRIESEAVAKNRAPPPLVARHRGGVPLHGGIAGDLFQYGPECHQ